MPIFKNCIIYSLALLYSWQISGKLRLDFHRIKYIIPQGLDEWCNQGHFGSLFVG